MGICSLPPTIRRSEVLRGKVIMLFQAATDRNLGSRVVSSLGRIILGAALLVIGAAGQQARGPSSSLSWISLDFHEC